MRIGVVDGPDAPPGWLDRCVTLLKELSGVEVALVLRAEPSRAGHRPGPGDAERVRGARLDVLLDLTGLDFGTESGPVARYGVWSFHHGDGESYVRGPLSHWAPHCAGAVVHLALVATVDETAVPLALQSGCFDVRRSWARTLARGLEPVAGWPAKVCREAREFRESPLARGREARMRVVPIRTGMADVPRRARRRLMELRARLLRKARRWRREQWAIGVVRAPIHTFLARPSGYPVTWLPEPSRSEYFADPFGIRVGANGGILAERFDRRTGLGQLCVLSGDGPGAPEPPQPVLSLPVHVSYPFLFEDEGRVYCIPEMFQSGGVHLFEALDYPVRWRYVATLLERFPAIDPTVIRHGGRFWLWCTSGETRVLARSALYVWWATTLTGPWIPHVRNPVKYDVRSARPAGTPFEHASRLIRPAQDCSETYGGAVSLNRVTRLTPEEYEEETVAVVRPDPDGPYPAGLHTLSAFDDWTLIDGKRWVWCAPWGRRRLALHPAAASLRPALAQLR